MDADTKQIERYQKLLAEASSNAIPIAVQQTINNTTRHAWRYGRGNTDSDFRNRNNFTKRSQTYQITRELDIDKMVAVTGSSAEYMAEQETGFTRQSEGRGGVWVPTADAAGQTGERTKPVQYRHRKGKMRLRKKFKRKPTSPAQAKLFKMFDAVMGNGYFWGELNNTTGMWKMSGNVYKGRLILTSVRLLYSADKRRITTKAHEWHLPGVQKAINTNEAVEYQNALERQWKRLKQKNRIK